MRPPHQTAGIWATPTSPGAFTHWCIPPNLLVGNGIAAEQVAEPRTRGKGTRKMRAQKVKRFRDVTLLQGVHAQQGQPRRRGD